MVSGLIPRFYIFFGMDASIMLGSTWYLVCVDFNCRVSDPLSNISILRTIFVYFVEKYIVHTHCSLPTTLEAGQGKHNTFYFPESFHCFRLNKSVLETPETTHTDSQLHFAPKISKIHLLVFENEFIEDATQISKSIKTENACLVMYGRLCTWMCYSYNHTWLKHAFLVLELFWN